MKKALVFFFILFLVACGSNQQVISQKEETKTEPTMVQPTEEVFESYGPEAPISPEIEAENQSRISYFEKVQKNLSNIAVGLKNPAISEISDFVSRCSILVPREDINVQSLNKSAAQIVKMDSPNCGVIVIKPIDKSWKEFVNSNDFASYEPNMALILFRMPRENEVSLDFLSMVMAHEAIHNMDTRPCEFGDYQCKTESEFTAYVTEFYIFDYLGSKNPQYLNVLNAEASASAELYRKSGKYELPDYSKQIMVRNFFESDNDYRIDSGILFGGFARIIRCF